MADKPPQTKSQQLYAIMQRLVPADELYEMLAIQRRNSSYGGLQACIRYVVGHELLYGMWQMGNMEYTHRFPNLDISDCTIILQESANETDHPESQLLLELLADNPTEVTPDILFKQLGPVFYGKRNDTLARKALVSARPQNNMLVLYDIGGQASANGPYWCETARIHKVLGEFEQVHPEYLKRSVIEGDIEINTDSDFARETVSVGQGCFGSERKEVLRSRSALANDSQKIKKIDDAIKTILG